MSCPGNNATWRVLDHLVGFEQRSEPPSPATADDTDGPEVELVGFDDPTGVRLPALDVDAVGTDPLDARIPPAVLAHSRYWYLTSPLDDGILRLDPCCGTWRPLHSPCPEREGVTRPRWIAARGNRVAASEPLAGRIVIWTNHGQDLLHQLDVPSPGPIAFDATGLLVVFGVGDRARLLRIGRDMRMVEVSRLPSMNPRRPARLGVDQRGRAWIVGEAAGRSPTMWSLDGDAWTTRTLAELAEAFVPTNLALATEEGFCLTVADADGIPRRCCYSWFGRPLCQGITAPERPVSERHGSFVTAPLDSRIPGCVWHRVRLDADLPEGARIRVRAAAIEDEASTSVHPADWWQPPDNSTDFLIKCQPGRYLMLRVEFFAAGAASPVLRRVRIDYPRNTAARFLPAVYLDEPDAADFTERFIALLESSIGGIDEAIRHQHRLVDSAALPKELLGWLGALLGLAFDPTTPVERKCALISAAPELFRRRGTVEGVRMAVKTALDVEPVIEEQFVQRSWGAVAGRGASAVGSPARLGITRLFGSTRARFRLGRSALRQAPLRALGDPDRDPLDDHAYRVTITIPVESPARPGSAGTGLASLERLIRAHAPAHLAISFPRGQDGLFLTGLTRVGIDTAFTPPPPPLLNSGLRLGRTSVLWAGARRRATGVRVGITSVIGPPLALENCV